MKNFPHYKHTINHNYFNIIDSEDKAYFLGLLYADGCISKNRNRIQIKLQDYDKEILEKFIKCLDYSKKLKIKKYSNIKNTYRDQYLLTIDSKKIKEDLIKNGCIPNKCQLIKLPNIDDYLIHHFIRGFFDGDGSIVIDKYNNKRFSLTSNYEFLDEIQNILIKKCNLKKIKICKVYNSFTLHYGGNKSCERIKDFLYEDSNFFLERKRNKFYEL